MASLWDVWDADEDDVDAPTSAPAVSAPASASGPDSAPAAAAPKSLAERMGIKPTQQYIAPARLPAPAPAPAPAPNPASMPAAKAPAPAAADEYAFADERLPPPPPRELKLGTSVEDIMKDHTRDLYADATDERVARGARHAGRGRDRGRGGGTPAGREPKPARPSQPAERAPPRGRGRGGASASGHAGSSAAHAVLEKDADEDALTEEGEEEDDDDDDMRFEDKKEEEEEDESIDSWPRLNDPRAPKVDVDLGRRPRAVEGSQYPSTATLPGEVAQFLRPYQLDGVKFMWGQYAQDKGGVLGDEMGLGKTVQVAAFLNVVLGKTATRADRDRPYPMPEADCHQALIVVPSSTVDNWKRELTTWGCFRVKIAHGTLKDGALRAARAREVEIIVTTCAGGHLHLAVAPGPSLNLP